MRLALLLAAVLLAGCATSVVTETKTALPPKDDAASLTTGCGVERWAIKTGTDPQASQVDLTPKDTTVSDLGNIIPPAVQDSPTRAPTELATYHVQATLTVIKEEADSDYHLALSDNGHSMIAESPNPHCAAGSVFLPQITQVRQAINQACPHIPTTGFQRPNIPVDVTGVGFFDRIHGQFGVAPNGIELHPTLSITLHGRC